MHLDRIKLGNLEVSRLIAGSNQISGFSHASAERSREMIEYFTVARIKEHLAECEKHEITALVARADNFIMRILGEYWKEGGKIKWIAQTAPEHRDPLRLIQQAAGAGASAIYIHGGQIDRLCAEADFDQIRTRLEKIKELGLPAGVAAHDPSNLLRIQDMAMPVDFYLVCLYNISGYQGRKDIEPAEEFNYSDRAYALEALKKLEKPCVVYKIFAAGRLSRSEAFQDLGPILRESDGVLIGMFPPDNRMIIKENVDSVIEMSRSKQP